MKTGHIVDCFNTELKTFFNKRYWWALIFIFLIPVIFIFDSFSGNGHFLYEDYKLISFSNPDYIHDFTAITDDIDSIYNAYVPGMAFNNSMAMLVVFGLLLVPILFTLYACSEYRSKVNRYKNVSLPRERVLAKISVCAGVLFASMVVYSIFYYAVSYFCWGKYLSSMFEKHGYQPKAMDIGLEKNIKCFLAAYFILLFYSVFGMLISFLSRSSITGVIVTVVVYFTRIPFGFSPSRNFSNVLSNAFYSNESSSFSFDMLEKSDHSVSLSIVILMVYFVLMLTAVFLTGNIRKNRNKTNI